MKLVIAFVLAQCAFTAYAAEVARGYGRTQLRFCGQRQQHAPRARARHWPTLRFASAWRTWG
jgi:hypothetical protein